MAPCLQYSCLENPTDGGAWWAAVHGVPQSRIGLSDFTLTFHFHALEKEVATHSSVLAWRIPGMGGGAWWAAVYGVTQSRTLLKQLSSSSSSKHSIGHILEIPQWVSSFPYISLAVLCLSIIRLQGWMQ